MDDCMPHYYKIMVNHGQGAEKIMRAEAAEITAVYDMYWGTWIGEDDSELIVGLNGSGEDRFEWYDADEELTASGYIQLVPV